ncbi:MAG: hypothetical protein R3B13_12955 [Polyangiaceae bacterium]
MNNLAWVLATFDDSRLRDGARAVELALEALRRAPRSAPMMGTLAAAYAEVGSFTEAVVWQEASNQQLSQWNPRYEDSLGFLELFKQGKPVRDPTFLGVVMGRNHRKANDEH